MQVKPLRQDLQKYLQKHGLIKRYEKQVKIFCDNFHHPSLHTEVLQPKKLRIYSFRLDQKYRAIFILITPDEAEIVEITAHYR